jgi:hypothetical protein
MAVTLHDRTGDRWSARLAPSPQVLVRRLEDEVVLVNLDTDRMFTLSATAARCWELLEETGSLAAAHARIVEEFAVEPDRLTRDLEQLMDTLEAERLIVALP